MPSPKSVIIRKKLIQSNENLRIKEEKYKIQIKNLEHEKKVLQEALQNQKRIYYRIKLMN